MPQNKRFTVDEIEFIKSSYSVMSVEELAEYLNRTPKAVRAKIERLGLKLSTLPRNAPYSWSDEDLLILKNNHTLPDHKLHEMLPKYSMAQITRKRLELGLRKHFYTPYIASDYYQFFRDGRRIWLHKDVMEKKIGRELTKDELVHHINGNKLDNNPNNLFLCANRKHHGLIHAQLEKVAFELIEKGIIKFNHSTGEYYLE
ncbi:HNH endonuclease [Priestia megaterium]|uniref:HNH endonuclease n=1 Tax=Priestia megaterium TaxID=1404 RepID=UPI0019234C07|nr:HNH endonuclease [Priestia megaterium]